MDRTVILLADVGCQASRVFQSFRRCYKNVHMFDTELATFNSVSSAALAVLQAYPSGPLWIAGHGLGGTIALEVSRLAPNRLDGIALFNTMARAENTQMQRQREALINYTRQTGSPVETLELLLPTLLHTDTIYAHTNAQQQPNCTRTDYDKTYDRQYVVPIVRQMAEKFTAQEYINQQIQSIQRRDHRPDLKTLFQQEKSPHLLVIASRDDIIIPFGFQGELWEIVHAAKGMKNVISSASNVSSFGELVVIDSVGHLTPLECPDRVTQAMLRWVNSA